MGSRRGASSASISSPAARNSEPRSRALANRPALILADEPTDNLDSAHGAETMRLLRRLAKEEGTTVVIVSHDERLREVADRVLWLEDGRLKTLERSCATPSAGC